MSFCFHQVKIGQSFMPVKTLNKKKSKTTNPTESNEDNENPKSKNNTSPLIDRYDHHFNSNLDYLFKIKPKQGGLEAIEIESLLLYYLRTFLKPGHREGLYMFSDLCGLNSSGEAKEQSVFLVPMYLKLMMILCQEIENVRAFISTFESSNWISVSTYISFLFLLMIYIIYDIFTYDIYNEE